MIFVASSVKLIFFQNLFWAFSSEKKLLNGHSAISATSYVSILSVVVVNAHIPG